MSECLNGKFKSGKRVSHLADAGKALQAVVQADQSVVTCVVHQLSLLQSGWTGVKINNLTMRKPKKSLTSCKYIRVAEIALHKPL